MTDQLLAELRKMRSTRTNLGLLARDGRTHPADRAAQRFHPEAARARDTRQPARAPLGRHLGGALRRADRRDGDHERVPPRHHPPDVRRHAAPDPRHHREGHREPADGRPLRARRDRALLRRRLRDPLGPRHPARARDEPRPLARTRHAGDDGGVGRARRRPRRGRAEPGLRGDRTDRLGDGHRQPPARTRPVRSAATRRSAPAPRSSPTPPTTSSRRPRAACSCSATSPPSSPPAPSLVARRDVT